MALLILSNMETKTIYKAEFDAAAPKRVDKITIKWEFDESPDTSHLGEYSNTPERGAIDRKERGDMERGEYQYFNPCIENYEGESEENIAKYVEQDYQRMEKLARNDWCFMGCVVEAEVSYPLGNGSRRIERFTSGGLWGIESDSDARYIDSIELEQIKELSEHLEQFGVEWPEFETA